jgi:hypothetical protein
VALQEAIDFSRIELRAAEDLSGNSRSCVPPPRTQRRAALGALSLNAKPAEMRRAVAVEV